MISAEALTYLSEIKLSCIRTPVVIYHFRKYFILLTQGSTLRKNFISPAGLVTIILSSPEISLLARKIEDIDVQYYFSC